VNAKQIEGTTRELLRGAAEINNVADSHNERSVIVEVIMRLQEMTWTAKDLQLIVSCFDDDGHLMNREFIRNRIGRFDPAQFSRGF